MVFWRRHWRRVSPLTTRLGLPLRESDCWMNSARSDVRQTNGRCQPSVRSLVAGARAGASQNAIHDPHEVGFVAASHLPLVRERVPEPARGCWCPTPRTRPRRSRIFDTVRDSVRRARGASALAAHLSALRCAQVAGQRQRGRRAEQPGPTAAHAYDVDHTMARSTSSTVRSVISAGRWRRCPR